MALHKVTLPKSARLLFRVVALQKRLLKALAAPTLDAAGVDVAWLQGVWSMQDAEWVRKFCLGGKESVLHPLRELAGGPQQARQALYGEFCRQNSVPRLLAAGGDFRDLAVLPGFTADLAEAVRKFFARCYELLGHRTGDDWLGYVFRARTLSKASYTENFWPEGEMRSACPYCDDGIGTPDLDHYYAKSHFPLLACNPFNLVPVCKSCNTAADGKGQRIALTSGPPRTTNGWLHPYEQPASEKAVIRLTGPPAKAEREFHSPDAQENAKLGSHSWLIQFRERKPTWRGCVTAFCDKLTKDTRTVCEMATRPATEVVSRFLENLQDPEVRGISAYAMIHAAVCRAFLEGRPGYLDELQDSNPPGLA